MRKLTPAKLTEGMVLAKPLLDPNGKVLLGPGAALTEKLVAKIVSLDVPSVFVEGEPQCEEERNRPNIGYLATRKTRGEILALIDAKFRGVVEGDPVMTEIRNCVVDKINTNMPKDE